MQQHIFVKVFIWLFHLTYLRDIKLIAWRNILIQDSSSKSYQATQNLKTPRIPPRTKDARLNSAYNLCFSYKGFIIYKQFKKLLETLD